MAERLALELRLEGFLCTLSEGVGGLSGRVVAGVCCEGGKIAEAIFVVSVKIYMGNHLLEFLFVWVKD